METILSIDLQFDFLFVGVRVELVDKFVNVGWTEPLLRASILVVGLERDTLFVWLDLQVGWLVFMVGPTPGQVLQKVEADLPIMFRVLFYFKHLFRLRCL